MYTALLGCWVLGATEQKTRLRIQATSTIESDGLRSGRNRRMATIRDRLGHTTATQRLGSIKYLLMRANLRPVCWLWVNRSSTASQKAASAARIPIELALLRHLTDVDQRQLKFPTVPVGDFPSCRSYVVRLYVRNDAVAHFSPEPRCLAGLGNDALRFECDN
jgi:hypothetical protein